ncbi:MAG TPA: SLC13 family permease [Candidatus Hydrogenedentes bacterium]|nr:SLC13 family permease [Candidatus Hydrogenedentota bacterium]
MEWFQGGLTIGVLVVIFVGLVRNYAADSLLIGGAVVLCVAGVISPEEAFAGFSNHGMLTVAALFVVTAALAETGALAILGRWFLGRARTEGSVLARMSLSITAASAFLNNTPIVAMFIPVVNQWCRANGKAPSRLLIPVSYFAILGGTCTLIGTSTNLVVNGMMTDAYRADPVAHAALRPMGLFEMSMVGIPYAIVGIAYILILGRRLLPERKGFMEQMNESAREYLANMEVQPGCGLVGVTVADAGLRRLDGLYLLEIQRGDEVIAPVEPTIPIRDGDLLTFTGAVQHIVDLERIPGLHPIADPHYEHRAAERRGHMLFEAVMSNRSPLLGQTIRDSNFRARYNAAVVAVNRGGERLKGRVGDIVLRPGDTLLLQAGPHFRAAHRSNPDFYLISGVDDSRAVRDDRAVLSLILLGLLVALMATGLVPIVVAAFLVAGLMIATNCISLGDARESIDLSTLLTICAAFGISKALMNSGVAYHVAHLFTATAGQWGPYALLAAMYLMTSIFTEVVTNNAAAALMFPFAVSMAQQADLSPRPFVIAVAFAASASFVTPLGYQTNLMVLGPGGYKVTDFARIGLPISLVLWIMGTVLIPIAWPF